MRKLYKFYVHFGDDGWIESAFISNDEEIEEELIGKELYFFEMFGQHSEIYHTVDKEDITVITENKQFIDDFHKHIGFSIGPNPFDFIVNLED